VPRYHTNPIISWVKYRVYKRRARTLRTLRAILGHEFAIEYGRRRNWIEKHDGHTIWLRGPGTQ
jgi:hypothetical protein